MSMKTVYTAKAAVDNGREHGRGRSSDGLLDVELELPAELGGPGGATNPEQLFAVGYAACFASAIADIISKQTDLDVGELSIDSKVALKFDGENYDLAVDLDVMLPRVADDADAVKIVADAHRTCPYSRATSGNIEVTLSANGNPVD
jgi:osmotically inducible protein OsmC